MAPMGIGLLGAPDLIIKRKFRFTVTIDPAGESGKVPEHYVRLSGRPSIDIDQTELNFRNAVAWLPGKARWQPLTITYYDVAAAAQKPLYDWLASIYNFQKPIDLKMSERCGFGQVHIVMYDGCGTPVERWDLLNAWPATVNWSDLDYADGDFATVELTIRYDQVQYSGESCGFTPSGTCCGC